MRVGEVLRLNTADVDPGNGVLTVWLSKFGKSRLVPLASSTITALTEYRQQLPPNPATPGNIRRPRRTAGQLPEVQPRLRRPVGHHRDHRRRRSAATRPTTSATASP